MDEPESLSHTKWECKYHVVFIPKGREKTFYKELWRHLREVFRRLAEQKESQIGEGHLRPYDVHMMIAIQPKREVSQVIGESMPSAGLRTPASSLRTPAPDGSR
jgi:putative transposase